MTRRYFTLAEAQRALPKVKLHLEKLMALQDEVIALSGVKVHAEQMDLTAHVLAININKRFHELSFKYYAELEAVTKLGVHIKDVSQGIVDFYSKLGEKDIMLCWQFDEPAILHYHTEEDGFEGRKPIQELNQKLAEEIRSLL
ncbi:MAG: DUF2203 domain-containing protein [Candidatus Iainarchaeum archaeon]|uniref:DUF2203 domain-containing protein n=1 Tax=Candidatus Iainarchaeum sp. TaxID=3101447 RepID=A0A7T9DKC2_9ARCH|nr:MAG: DUF2203 domain-containing protein [Candidatus Diapherotrites archaeon]